MLNGRRVKYIEASLEVLNICDIQIFSLHKQKVFLSPFTLAVLP
jgi:hypothetical protein